jgi:polysaccharide export outer membrane protein
MTINTCSSAFKPILILVALCLSALTLYAERSGAQSPSPEQLELLKSLPADQRDALMQQMGGRSTGVNKRDQKLEFPETVVPRTAEDLEREKRNETLFGEVRLRGDDTLLIRLEIRDFTGPDAELMSAAQWARHASTSGQTPPVDNPPPRQPIQRTPAERQSLEALRDKIQGRNPYTLDKFGVLNVPELEPILLAGLTVEEARQRLAVEAPLKDFQVNLTLLSPVGDQALKPFGYDLFAGSPTTFAPATEIPVPADYVVGPGDEIDIQLFGNNNKSYALIVNRDGRINFPELGPIVVSGLRFSEVKRSLEARVGSQMIGVRTSITMGYTRAIRIFVLGEAEQPGSYTVSGLSTITNALFACGGVKTIGSLRDIQLKRRGEVVGRLDLYDLLLKGDTSADMRLLPGDVIFIPPVGPTAGVMGEVRRPAIYELKGAATVDDLVHLAGGLTPDADPGITRLERINEQRERVVLNLDLTSPAGKAAPLATGDLLRIQPIRTVMENAVLLQGHVYRPGNFQYAQGMHLSDVLGSLDQLKPQADTHYVLVRRELPDGTITVLSADLAKALMARGSNADIALMPKDRLTVIDLKTGRDRVVAPLIEELRLQSKLDRPLQVVSVGGQINAPGPYPLEQGMRVSDLIRAGGSLDEAAYGGKAELARYQPVNGEYRRTELIDIDLAAALRGDQSADRVLQPYDFLNIKELPLWSAQEEIEVAGEVKFPGRYRIQRGETLRSVLLRAGGLTDLAFPEGSVFLREELRSREQQQLDALAKRMQSDIAMLSLQAMQLGARTGAQAAQIGPGPAVGIGEALLAQLLNTKAVGRLVINLDKVIASTLGSEFDIMLKGGDRLLIPRKTQEVTVLGEVETSTSHLYRSGLSRDDYINMSGGPSPNAAKKNTYIVRADGSVVARGSRWFQSSAVDIHPGDSIVVPLDTERVPALPMWQAVTQILYNTAVAVAAVHSVGL